MTSRNLRRASVVALGVALSTAAFGLPWDIDMADSQAKDGYSIEMEPAPEGVVAQPSMLSPRPHAPNFQRGTPEGNALSNPYDANVELGDKMYNIYCTPCHGDGVELGPVAQPGRFPGVVALAGDSGIVKSRTDGWVYLTIRNGGAIMPNYGWAMSDQEIWSIVDYVRTMPKAQFIPPKPRKPTPAAE
ncbi:MAG: mono/diheme cytochrome c family protein [Myxococcota bacterium]|jgi:mono/diheme cytochrome c family protein